MRQYLLFALVACAAVAGTTPVLAELRPENRTVTYMHTWETGTQAKADVGRWITFYNHLRRHAAHGGQPPAVVYFNATPADQ
jgi:hypothetical protein